MSMSPLRSSFGFRPRHWASLIWFGKAVLCLGFLPGILSQAATDEAAYRSQPLEAIVGQEAGFSRLSSTTTGIDFHNKLTGDLLLTNVVVNNGSGLAIGDVDGDGWADLYFCALQGANRLYRNLGGWRFQELDAGAASCDRQYSTAAAFADIDGDRDLDLLVNGIVAGTRLFLNDGQGRFSEATETGLSRTASAMSLALADIDNDSDLDLYCAHYVDAVFTADPTTRYELAKRNGRFTVARVNGQSTDRPEWQGRFEVSRTGKLRELPEADGLYLNEGGGRFRSIGADRGTFRDRTGKPVMPPRDWGLAVMFRDLDRDGDPDLYVCNDNASPDRIWLNSGDGTFQVPPPWMIRHTSRSSMGVDFADVDRDGYDDFVVVDMFASGHADRMNQLVKQFSDAGTILRPDGQPRYNRNTFYLGRSDGTYLETALMAGLSASDWSWCPVFVDVDLDGYEDLLISNGFSFDIMDQDSHDKLSRLKLSVPEMKRQRRHHPGYASANLAFRNRRNGRFEVAGRQWKFDIKGISYGMALGDLDNDGDFDVVVNQLNQEALVLRNTSPASRIKVALRSRSPNAFGIGARVRVHSDDLVQSQTLIAGGRYLSGDQAVRVFAFPVKSGEPVSLEVTWPGGRISRLTDIRPNRFYLLDDTKTRPSKDSSIPPAPLFANVGNLLSHAHRDIGEGFLPANSELPGRLGMTGPGVAWFDVNQDDWDDLLITGGYGDLSAVWLNRQGESFERLELSSAVRDRQGPVTVWDDGQGNRFGLTAVSQSSSFSGGESALHFYRFGPTPGEKTKTVGPAGIGALAVADIDADGDLDLFIGGVPPEGRYPESADSAVWLNQQGQLEPNVAWSRAFRQVGIVRGATFLDENQDGRPDLALALEWGPVRLFQNTGEKYIEATEIRKLNASPGWWTGLSTGDFDGDGRLDLAVGNRGLNTSYALYSTDRIRIWYAEHEGSIRALESWRQHDRWLPMANRSLLEPKFPELVRKYPTHRQFANASVPDLLDPFLERYRTLNANVFESGVFLNRLDGYVFHPFPTIAQSAPGYAVAVADFDADGREDVFLGQNDYSAADPWTRNDGGRGVWLRGQGDGTFEPIDVRRSGLVLYARQRGAALADYDRDGRIDLAVAQLNAPTELYRNLNERRGWSVRLVGPKINPDAIGTRMRLVYDDGTMGAIREIVSGSGFASRHAATQVLGGKKRPAGLWIRWPDGTELTRRLETETREIRLAY